jgi:hypothetical protein
MGAQNGATTQFEFQRRLHIYSPEQVHMRRILCEDPDGLRGKVDAVANRRQACEKRHFCAIHI